MTTAESITAAARALLEAEGAGGVTMRRVAEAVGITPMAIYRHFESREALLESLAEAGFAELAAASRAKRGGDDAVGRIGSLLDSYLDYAFERPRLFEYMFSAARPGARRFPDDFSARRSPTANLLYDAVHEGVARGELRDDDPWEVCLA
ncbi:MAG TPA: TetR/AcrR family transcriptional regulator, partial [Polyangiaceae bacterium]|nr:TetR/AcrR family transcriptional regulator [Polyangiaceae bacterium]